MLNKSEEKQQTKTKEKESLIRLDSRWCCRKIKYYSKKLADSIQKRFYLPDQNYWL